MGWGVWHDTVGAQRLAPDLTVGAQRLAPDLTVKLIPLCQKRSCFDTTPQVGTNSPGRSFAHLPISCLKLLQPTTSHSISTKSA